MISASDVTLSFGQQRLFKEVNLKFIPGNCYGVIGANGSGKTTFLKILSGEIEPDTGSVFVTPGERVAVLRQDHFAFDDYTVLNATIIGHRKLFDTMMEREALYDKEEFSEEDGIRAAELEGEFAEIGGWEAEAQAAMLLSGLGIPEALHGVKLKELESGQKVRVLLAQALFGDPEVLLLDEPTNGLDLESIGWLEEFLFNFNNTVIVVSHDRHFLNRVCTHIVDIDYGKLTLFVGNYDFWYRMSQLVKRQMKEEKHRREEKISELKSFIQRFSSNAAKSKQATSRKKLLDKLSVEDFKPSSRRFPWVGFQPNRECGNKILEIEGLSFGVDEESRLDDFSLSASREDKIALVGPLHHLKSRLMEVLSGGGSVDSGQFEWGTTITLSYLAKDHGSSLEESPLSIIEWLSQYTESDDESYIRGFLGRMLFTGEESLKGVKVLSGGERVRCHLARMMLSGANAMMLDEPTNHLDLEAITALNDGLIAFKGFLVFASHDHTFVSSIANRIIEFTPSGVIDRRMGFDDYLNDSSVQSLRDELYHGHQRNTL